MKWKVEKSAEYLGYQYVVVFTQMGHRCGYVGVPKSHPMHGRGYGENLPFLKMSTIEQEPIGKRGIIPVLCRDHEEENTSADVYFNVHGGVTFAGRGIGDNYPVEGDLWWFGFDCAHCDDGKDLSQVEAYGLVENQRQFEELKRIEHMFNTGGEMRSFEYVERECHSFIEQIIAAVEGVG